MRSGGNREHGANRRAVSRRMMGGVIHPVRPLAKHSTFRGGFETLVSGSGATLLAIRADFLALSQAVTICGMSRNDRAQCQKRCRLIPRASECARPGRMLNCR